MTDVCKRSLVSGGGVKCENRAIRVGKYAPNGPMCPDTLAYYPIHGPRRAKPLRVTASQRRRLLRWLGGYVTCEQFDKTCWQHVRVGRARREMGGGYFADAALNDGCRGGLL